MISLALALVVAYEPTALATALKKNSVDGECLIQARFSREGSTATTEESKASSFHDVVGKDGALMITLDRLPGRSAWASKQLAKVGIWTTHFSASNGHTTSPEALSKACIIHDSDNAMCPGWFPSEGKFGGGCKDPTVQAIALSHMSALQYAMTRKEEWTAIFEDDAVPVLPAGIDWDSAFRKAWRHLPKTAKVVRLGWCQFPVQAARFPEPTISDGSFKFVQYPVGSENGYDGTAVGGCTTGYMVHRSVIPSMMSIFPCCAGVDACLEQDFYAKQDPAILSNLMVAGGDKYITEHGGDKHRLKFRGVIMQAAELGSTRT